MGSTNGRTGVVVDGYSAGNFLPAAFKELGTRLVHVQSTPEMIPTMLPPNLADYHENIVCLDETAVVDRLGGYSPVCVMAGQESAVQLADRLSEALGLPTNGSRLSAARRDKYEMIEALRRAGLHCARQLKSHDPAVLAAWAERGGSYPVVVKPLSSAGTDGVYVCHGPHDVLAAARAVLSARDIFGTRNEEALVQSYLEGTEYIVDTVSCAGQRYVCGVWRYEKSLTPGGRNIYDRDILVDPDQAPVPDLVAYVDQVLTALGIRWGAAHAEVMMTPDGPALVEIGARVNGNLNPRFHDACLGNNQSDLAVLAYLRPEEFRRRFGGRVYDKLKHAVVYNAPTELDGVVDSVDEAAVGRIQGLESVHTVGVKLRPGSRIRPTVDLMSSPLRVFLAAASEQQLMADYTQARRLKDSVFRVVRP